MQKVLLEQQGCMGIIWIIGWLFTIGYVQLGFWQGALAIVIWPYHIGVMVQGLLS